MYPNPKCPHEDFEMSLDILTGMSSGGLTRVLWSCMKCECKFTADGNLELIAVRLEVCDRQDEIGVSYA